MNVESFCRAILLKQPAKVDDLLKSLPEDIREEVRAGLDKLQKLSEAQIRSQWKKSRSEEVRVRTRLAEERSGVDLMRVSPRNRAALILYLEQFA
jgi:hypothetical protein